MTGKAAKKIVGMLTLTCSVQKKGLFLYCSATKINKSGVPSTHRDLLPCLTFKILTKLQPSCIKMEKQQAMRNVWMVITLKRWHPSMMAWFSMLVCGVIPYSNNTIWKNANIFSCRPWHVLVLRLG